VFEGGWVGVEQELFRQGEIPYFITGFRVKNEGITVQKKKKGDLFGGGPEDGILTLPPAGKRLRTESSGYKILVGDEPNGMPNRGKKFRKRACSGHKGDIRECHRTKEGVNGRTRMGRSE